jgi:arabinose-5-phosphate isomerase
LQKSESGIELINCAREVIAIEKSALEAFSERLGEGFLKALNIIGDRVPPGKVTILGMGKSGHIGRKISATLASTGTPSFSVHPAEAGHGDLGMISPNDVVIAISQSGTSEELLGVLPYFKRYAIPVIAFTGNFNSALAEYAAAVIDTSVEKEACPLGLAPTASSMLALAAGDALAMCLLKRSGFTPEDFAQRHPHGFLGRRLLVKIEDLMLKGADIPKVKQGANILETLIIMTRGSVGAVGVVDENDKVLGIFTDGDLRRALVRGSHMLEMPIKDSMTKTPKMIHADRLAVEAIELMDKLKINLLLVVSENGLLIGLINMRMLIHAGVV